jgi:hypothetical protein
MELTAQEQVSARMSTTKRVVNMGSWKKYTQEACGFITKTGNNTRTNIKYRLHLKMCQICQEHPSEESYKIIGSWDRDMGKTLATHFD